MKKKEQINYNIYNSVYRLLDLDVEENISDEMFECILNAKNLNDLKVLESGLKKMLDK